MKLWKNIVATAFVFAFLFVISVPFSALAEEAPSSASRVIFNEDINTNFASWLNKTYAHPFYMDIYNAMYDELNAKYNGEENQEALIQRDVMHAAIETIDETVLRNHIRSFKGSNVTDFFMNVNTDLSASPSEVMETFAGKWYKKQETLNGTTYAVDYTNEYYVALLHSFEERGFDHFKIYIDECRKQGMKPWISFRMNDVHSANELSWLNSDFRYNARANGYIRAMHREQTGHYDLAYNYSVPAVRNRYLNYIKEQASNYDIDGVELDFMREMYCFAPGEEAAGREIINDFIRDVRAHLDSLEVTYGHKIEIAVRVPATPYDAYEAGYDVYTWDKEALVDVIIPSARWWSTDATIPVQFWQTTVKNADIIPCISDLISNTQLNTVTMAVTLEQAIGLSHQYTSTGADGVYLFNFYQDGNSGVRMVPFNNSDASSRLVEPTLFRTVGNTETTAKMNRSHVLTNDDITSIHLESTGQRNLPLPWTPATASYLNQKDFQVMTGTIPEDADVFLVLTAGISGGTAYDQNSFAEICVNDNPKIYSIGVAGVNNLLPYLKYPTINAMANTATTQQKKTMFFKLPHEYLNDDVQTIEIRSYGNHDDFIVSYLEIRVVPTNAKVNGVTILSSQKGYESVDTTFHLTCDNTAIAKNAVVALYDENGILVDVANGGTMLAAEKEITFTVSVPTVNYDKAHTAKVMLVDSLTGIKPLTVCGEVEIQ